MTWSDPAEPVGAGGKHQCLTCKSAGVFCFVHRDLSSVACRSGAQMADWCG